MGDSLRTATASTRGVMPSVAEACDRPAVTGVTPVTPFLSGFAFTGYNTESYVISPPEGLELEILHLKQQQPELSFGEIAKQLKTNKMKVKRVLERYPVKSEILKPKFENPLPLTDSRLRGNDNAPTALPPDPFRGDVGKSNQPSELGVQETSSPCPLLSPAALAQGGMPNAGSETPVTTTTDTPAMVPSDLFRGGVEKSNQPSNPGVTAGRTTQNTDPKTLNKKLTFSQRVKMQIAKANVERMKAK